MDIEESQEVSAHFEGVCGFIIVTYWGIFSIVCSSWIQKRQPITPVYCGAATRLWGVIAMMDSIAASFHRHTAKGAEKSVAGEEIAIDLEGDPAIFVFKTVADPFVGKMSFFKVMNGSVKKDWVLKNARTGGQEKLAHIYFMKGYQQMEVDELACGDIGMVSKLSDTNTNDTLSRSGKIEYAKVNYANPYYCMAMSPLTAKDESKISQAIARMTEEDMTLKYENNPETKQQLTLSSTLAWKIPWMEEPGRLLSMGSLRVGHD